MTFDEIHLQNFMAHVDSRLALRDRGVVLIAGERVNNSAMSSNGAGKTSLIPDGLAWTLWGKTLRGTRGDAVVNRQVGKNCLGRVIFTTARGDRIEVIRAQKHSKEKSRVIVGSETYVGTAEIDRVISQVMGVGFDAATASIIFGKGKTKFFTQRTDAERKAILEELMSLSDLSKFLKVTREKLSALKAQESILRHEIEKLDVAITAAESSAKQFAEQASKFESWQAGEIERLTRAVQELAGRRGPVEAKRAEAKATHAKLEAVIAALDPICEEATAAVREIKTRRSTRAQEMAAVRAEYNRLQAELARVQKLKGNCPQCLQLIRPEHVERCSAALTEAKLQQQTRFAELKKADDADAQAEAAADAALQQKLALRKEASQQIAAAANAGVQAENELVMLAAEAKRLEEGIASVRGMRNDAVGAAAQQRELLAKHQARQQELVAQRAALEETKLFLDFWEYGFSNQGLKSLLLGDITPYLNRRAAHYSQLLTDGAVKVLFSTLRELKGGGVKDEFDVQVLIEDGGEAYDEASDGEKRRGDIIATLALGDLAASRVAEKIDLIILDEVFDGLDEIGIERSIAMLHTIAKQRGTILVITHAPNLAQHFPTVVRVRKEGKIARLVEGAEALALAA